MSFYIPYALPHVTVETVTDTFQSIFGGNIKVNETLRKDRDTGKDFKLFWITIIDANKHLDFFIQEINETGSAKITYEHTKGHDRFWQVKLNLKVVSEPFKPRILKRDEA
jgi:hypothetical protein